MLNRPRLFPAATVLMLATALAAGSSAAAVDEPSTVDLATFTCQEHTDAYSGGPKSTDYTADRQVFLMIWLAGYVDPASKGIDIEAITTRTKNVLEICDENPPLKVLDAFGKASADVKPDAQDTIEAAKLTCFVIGLTPGSAETMNTVVAWLSGQRAGLAREQVFDFEKVKADAKAVLSYCADDKHKMSDLGAALEAIRR